MKDIYYIFSVDGDIVITLNDFGAIEYKHSVVYTDSIEYMPTFVSILETYLKLGDIKIITRSSKEAYRLLIDVNYYDFNLLDSTIISIDVIEEIVKIFNLNLDFVYTENDAENLLLFVRKFISLFESFNLQARGTLKALDND